MSARPAVVVAEELRGSFEDAVVVAELASVQNAALLAQTAFPPRLRYRQTRHGKFQMRLASRIRLMLSSWCRRPCVRVRRCAAFTCTPAFHVCLSLSRTWARAQ